MPGSRGRVAVGLVRVCPLLLASSIAAGGAGDLSEYEVGAQPPQRRLPVLPRFEHDRANRKLLFIDNAMFANLSGDIGLRRHRPSPRPVVLRPTEPWESFGLIGYHTVVQMGPQDYRMYYDTGWTMENRNDFHRYTVRLLTLPISGVTPDGVVSQWPRRSA